MLGPCRLSVLGRGADWGDLGRQRASPRSWEARFGQERSQSGRGIGPFWVERRTLPASTTKGAAGGAFRSPRLREDVGRGEVGSTRPPRPLAAPSRGLASTRTLHVSLT